MVAVRVEPAGRLLVDFGIKVVDTIGSERREPGNFCDLPVRPDGLPPSERQCWVCGVNVAALASSSSPLPGSERTNSRYDLLFCPKLMAEAASVSTYSESTI